VYVPRLTLKRSSPRSAVLPSAAITCVPGVGSTVKKIGPVPVGRRNWKLKSPLAFVFTCVYVR